MKQSFIRQGTFVVCTNMTCGLPQRIGVTRAARYVMNTKTNEPLLNVDDRKISASFCCRNPQSFYGGLCALCAGICIGVAFTAAIVFTGGAAAVFAATATALAFTTLVGVGSAIAYGIDHDCDETLACEWKDAHKGVIFEGRPALLNQSFMSCSRGGRIDIILNEQVALKAAAYISSCNNNALLWQGGSQAVQGVFMGMAAAATGPVGLVEMSVCVAVYCISEYNKDLGTPANAGGVIVSARNDAAGSYKATKTASKAKAAADQASKETSASKETMDAHKNTVKSVEKTASKPGRGQTAARQAQSQAQRAYNTEQGRHHVLKERSAQATKNHQGAISNRNATFTKLLGGLAMNIATAMLNYQIDKYSDAHEEKYIGKAQKESKETNASDQDNEAMNSTFMGIVTNET